jgi:hypothetical protein
VYNNRFTVWDVRNKANPVKIQDFTTDYSTVHNMWLSKNSKTLFVSHEVFNFPIEAFDISNLNNIRKLSEFKVSPTNEEIAHNVHVLNDFIISSYYSDGVAIFDVADPTNVITVGYYDTQPTSTRTENGVWGAYGFYKSGLITLSDMIKGLFVLRPNYVKAARIQGLVCDTTTLQPRAGVKISFVDTTINTLSSVDGIYKTGTPRAGTFLFKAEKAGYFTKYFTATLVNGRIDTVNIKMRNLLDTTTVTGITQSINDDSFKITAENQHLLIKNNTNSPVKQLNIFNSAGALVFSLNNPESTVLLPNLPVGLYLVRAISRNEEEHMGKIHLY